MCGRILSLPSIKAIRPREEKHVAYGGIFGKLPVPDAVPGKRFAGWLDENGNIVTESTVVSGGKSEIDLTSSWETISEEEKALLAPFSVTAAYHDMAATKYGVVWHNKTQPAYPVVLVQEGKASQPDLDAARIVAAEYEYWFWDEYTVSAVVDGLDFATQYTVFLGDLSANVWSRPYTFTTREEDPASAEFIFITDTKENYQIENMGHAGCYLGDTYSSQVLKAAAAQFPKADFIAHGGISYNTASNPNIGGRCSEAGRNFCLGIP